MLCAPHGPWIAPFDPLRARCDDLLGFRTQWSDQGSAVTPSNVRSMAFRSAFSALYSINVGPPLGTQFDLKQATGFETLSVVPMNTLLLIKEKELKAQRLQDAQRCFAAHSEGINHLCPSFPNEACFSWKLILLRSKKFTPLSVGFFIV